MSEQDPICIIGSGQAGVSLARELRKADANIPITLISQDAGGFYSKPMLSNAYAKNVAMEKLRMQDSQTLTEKVVIRTVTHTRVTAINPAQRLLTLQHQNNEETSEQRYSSLVLALGGETVKAPIKGIESALTVNHLDDYVSLRHKLAQLGTTTQKIVIVGGGLVGCELANDLHRAGYDIYLFEREEQLLNRIASKVISDHLQSSLQELGIHIFTNCQVQEIVPHKAVITDQGSFAADIVISAIGLQPTTTLAKQSGIETNRGILCDLFLQTSKLNIYALGDCTEVRGLVLPYILPIMEGAKALAATLTGNPTPLTYPCMPVAVKTTDCPLIVCPPLPPQLQLSPLIIEQRDTVDDDSIKTLYYVGEQLVGFCLAGTAVKERQSLASQTAGLLAQIELSNR